MLNQGCCLRGERAAASGGAGGAQRGEDHAAPAGCLQICCIVQPAGQAAAAGRQAAGRSTACEGLQAAAPAAAPTPAHLLAAGLPAAARTATPDWRRAARLRGWAGAARRGAGALWGARPLVLAPPARLRVARSAFMVGPMRRLAGGVGQSWP